MVNGEFVGISERPSGYWIVDIHEQPVDNKFTEEQPYGHIEDAKKILKSLRIAYAYGWKGNY